MWVLDAKLHWGHFIFIDSVPVISPSSETRVQTLGFFFDENIDLNLDRIPLN